MSKKRIVFLILDSEEPVHMEIISNEDEINKIIKLLECTYHFKYFSVVPIKEDK